MVLQKTALGAIGLGYVSMFGAKGEAFVRPGFRLAGNRLLRRALRDRAGEGLAIQLQAF